MKAAPVITTVEDLYPRRSVYHREPWYTDKSAIKEKRQFRWTVEERSLLYALRIRQDKSIAEIQKFFRKKNRIPIYLGPDDNSDKFSRTRLHNQIRIIKGSFEGLCYKCRKKLTQRDLKRINKKEKGDPSLGLCFSCTKEVAEYKKDRRETALKLGLCPICVKRRVLKGHTMCKACLSASHRRRYADGLCGKCGEHPLAKNSVSLCDGCLEENRKASKKYRLRKKRENKK